MVFYLFSNTHSQAILRQPIPAPNQGQAALQDNAQKTTTSQIPIESATRAIDTLQKPIPADYDSLDASSSKSTSASSLVGAGAGPRVNATFVTLARNVDVWDIARSIRQVEDRFNHRYHYDWVFLNDKPFDDTFRNVTSAIVSGTARFGQIPEEHWSVPDWIDSDKAQKVKEEMKDRKIIYGESTSYRHMCRFESGFFAQHPIMGEYEFYWRVEPSIELFCDIPDDPFRFMKENGKKYSFVISMLEYGDTIPTLWDSTKKFIENYPEHIAADNSMEFLSDDGGETYNMCHFVSTTLLVAVVLLGEAKLTRGLLVVQL